MNPEFDLAITNNTLVDYPRLVNLRRFAKEVPYGYVVEVGVYKGGTARLLCEESPHVFLFDTFEGMPAVRSNIDIHQQGDFADTSIEHVSGILYPQTNFSMYKGVFPKFNSEYVSFRKFSLVHLDVDIYDSVKECLEFFSPRMLPGGIIVLDDYLEPNCPGAKLAADEFARSAYLTVIPTCQSQAIIRF